MEGINCEPSSSEYTLCTYNIAICILSTYEPRSPKSIYAKKRFRFVEQNPLILKKIACAKYRKERWPYIEFCPFFQGSSILYRACFAISYLWFYKFTLLANSLPNKLNKLLARRGTICAAWPFLPLQPSVVAWSENLFPLNSSRHFVSPLGCLQELFQTAKL